MMKKMWLVPAASSALAIFLAFAPLGSVFAELGDDAKPNSELITVFWREGCAHCKKEREFLTKLQKQRPSLHLEWHDIGREENRKL
jgi:hypothetical protein